MYVTLEQPIGARLLLADGHDRPIPLTLRYTSADPLAVHIDFPAHVTADGARATWTFGRELLGRGLAAPAGAGSVRVRPYGPGDGGRGPRRRHGRPVPAGFVSRGTV